MDAAALRELQTPLKTKYRDSPDAALVTAEHSGETVIAGTGAGGNATAVAIISDINAIARDRAAIVPAPVLSADFELRTSNFELASAFLTLAEAV